VLELAADGTEAGFYVAKTLAVGQLSECHRQILIPTGQSFSGSDHHHISLRTSGTVVGEELDQLREDGTPCVHPALSPFPTRPPRTLENVIFISNRFNVKPHAFHWIYRACTLPAEVSPDSDLIPSPGFDPFQCSSWHRSWAPFVQPSCSDGSPELVCKCRPGSGASFCSSRFR
jgi:hypothetical protein